MLLTISEINEFDTLINSSARELGIYLVCAGLGRPSKHISVFMFLNILFYIKYFMLLIVKDFDSVIQTYFSILFAYNAKRK